jgi:hypothetical protein
MRCWSCQFENPPAIKFCGQCSTPLTALLPPGADIAGAPEQLARPPETQRQGYTSPHLAEKILIII